MPSVFDRLVSEHPALGYLAGFPARSRCSDARVLDRQTAVVADCEPGSLRVLFREWHDRRTAEELAEAVHQLELERAAQPPVIEVTVITPPEGIPRLELDRAVAGKIAGLLPAPGPGTLPPAWAAGPDRAVFPVCEDDVPTVVLPAVRPDGRAGAGEVYVP